MTRLAAVGAAHSQWKQTVSKVTPSGANAARYGPLHAGSVIGHATYRAQRLQ